MIPVQEALKIVLQHAWQGPEIELPVAQTVGSILAEDIVADRDFPPFDRVTMDGIALNRKAFVTQGPQVMIPVEATQFAGEIPRSLSNPTHCIEVMTGAVLPEGTDTVIRYEDVEIKDLNGQKTAIVQTTLPDAGHNVHHQGTDRQAGAVLVAAGRVISPAEVGVAASVGSPTLKVRQAPRVAIVSTGDELVDVHENPQAHQIRRSNSYMLQSALWQIGLKAELYHLHDNQDSIRRKVAELLDTYDALILNGGVSEGKADFVPIVLAELGVNKCFHKVAQRPGKPFWFGQSPTGKTVFALPGNPVSTFVCYYYYVLPWLLGPTLMPSAVLRQPVRFEPPLTYFLPVRVIAEGNTLNATPLKGSGSGDFANLLDCDGFLILPPEGTNFEAGQAYPLLSFR